MDRLWAPWREQYIKGLDKRRPKGCVFCRLLKDKNDAESFVFLRRSSAYAVLNIYPYSNGHCLIVSNRHVDDIVKLSAEELQDMMDAVIETKSMLQATLSPHGFNIGMNLGRLAGAGIPRHVHMHVVPRWKGDHNFMPVIGSTKVISQSLHLVYKALTDALKKRNRRTRR